SNSLLSMIFLLLLPLLVASQSNRCWSSGNGGSARWWNEGERIDRGRYWYECRRGELVPKGCFNERQQRLSVGESFIQDEYEVTCDLSSQGFLKFKQSACVGPNGRKFRIGETWVDQTNTYYYECKSDGAYLRVSIEGCVHHDKRGKVKIGEKYDHGEYTYECQRKSSGAVQMCSVGCLHQGQRFAIGEQWPDGDFVFYCDQKGGRCQKKCVGCQFRNKRLYDGDRYQKDQTVYQCHVRRDTYGHKPVACVSVDNDGTKVERVIGCRWYVQDSVSKVEQSCHLDGEQAKIITEGCIYRHNGFDTIWLVPNSYTIWNKPDGKPIGLACKPASNGALLSTFDADQASSQASGLKYDSPRGKK
ncbi:hypothetical protein PFISCL1PPCAC_5740, partial [Pristionchus fissidentatus]